MRIILVLALLALSACEKEPPKEYIYVCDEYRSRTVWIGKMITSQPYCVSGHAEHNPEYRDTSSIDPGAPR